MVFWVGDAAVKHVGEREDKGLFDEVDFGHGEVGIVELTVADFGGKDFVHHVGNLFWGRFFDGARGGFGGIGQGEYGHLFANGGGTAITEVGVVDKVGEGGFAIALKRFGFVIEVSNKSVAVVLFDSVENGLRKFMPFGEREAFFDVR